jgi:S1-C subfamily serine protease
VRLPEAQAALAGHPEAVLIMNVTDKSPAAAAGILVGDVLFELEGRAIDSPDDLLDRLSTLGAGSQASARLLRGATIVDATLTIGERPAS